MTDKEAVTRVYASAWEWFITHSKIETKDGRMVTPTPSKFQRDIFQAYIWLVARDLPVRIIAAPKARQSYGSTAVGAICYHHVRRTKCSAMVMADETSRVEKLWSMLRRFADHDGFNDLWDSRAEFNTEKGKIHFVDNSDGKKRQRTSEWEKETATDAAAGAGGTRQVLWFSECMRYAREGDASDTLVIGNALGSLPDNPGTAVFLESTAEGPGGYAYNVWQGAVTLRERVAGKIGNGWIKCFCAWHECTDYILDQKREDNAQWFDDEDERFALFREREQAGIKRFKWTPAQIAWRRKKLMMELDGSEGLFDRDFPESEEVAFRASGSPRFHPVGIANILSLAEIWHNTAKRGTLEENAGRVRFVEDRINGWLWMKEHPRDIVGAEICGFCDVMTGEQSAGSLFRDCHAPGILRNHFLAIGSSSVRCREVIAAIDIPGGCRFDIDYLAEKIALLSQFYDNPLWVPEANNPGIALILALKALGVSIWQRDQPDALNPGKKLKISGFRTDGKTKDLVVEAMAKHIRESSGDINEMIFRCDYLPAAQEFASFVRKTNGKCEAASGKFDDWVMGIGVALAADCWSYITPEARPRYSDDRPSSMSAVCS